MGFYATETVCECRKRRGVIVSRTPSKTRVSGFRRHATSKSRIRRSQSTSLQRLNMPAPQGTASGVPYYGYRFYSPELGRWPSRDPLWERGGLNVYEFVLNSPILLFDAFGLEDNRRRKNAPCDCGDTELNNAAKVWLQKAVDATQADHQKRERCGRLCCNKNTMKVTSTGMVVGQRVFEWVYSPVLRRKVRQFSWNCNPEAAPKCSALGEEYELAGYYHSHPHYPRFSPEDRDWIRNRDDPFFVWNGDDEQPIRRLDPAVEPSHPNVIYPPELPANPIESIIDGDGAMESSNAF